MTVGAIPNLFPKISALLLPLAEKKEERELWLTQAYYLTDPRLYYLVRREGTALEYVTHSLKTIFDYGCFADGTHAIVPLLEAIRNGVDADRKREIDELISQCNSLCSESEVAHIAGQELDRKSQPELLQTIVTPEAQRIPTIFVSYARADSEFIQRLIADLQAAGHAVWLDISNIKSDETWSQAISAGINNSYAFISVISKAAYTSKWVEREYHWADKKKNLSIFAVQIEACELPIYIIERQVTSLFPDYRGGLSRLLEALPSPIMRVSPQELDSSFQSQSVTQRSLELDYLERLRLEHWLKSLRQTEQYTPMAGVAYVGIDVNSSLLIPTRYRHMRHLFVPESDVSVLPAQEYTDIIQAMYELRRVILLGEPGAGKTTTLWKLAMELFEAAIKDPAAPIPIVVHLGNWTTIKQSLRDFIRREIGQLGLYFDQLIETKRVALLLDGMNEIPLNQRRAGKLEEIRTLFDSARQFNPDLISIVSCRARDYTIDLGFDRLEIMPLDPVHIREFVIKRLGQGAGEALFWRLAGGAEVRRIWTIWEQNGATLDQFFTATDVPRENPRIFTTTTAADDEMWRQKVRVPDSMMKLAQNPYLLMMITDLYREKGTLPENRGELFTQFIDGLMEREASANKHMTDRERELLRALTKLAGAMQTRQDVRMTPGGQSLDPDTDISGANGGIMSTALPVELVKANFMDDELLHLAASASLLVVGDVVSFTHQLLQEYFVATDMFHKIQAGQLAAADLWPAERWWEPTGWEEATILLAGFFSGDCSSILEWVQDANPEVAAQCLTRSGSQTPQVAKQKLQTAWLPRLTDIARDPDPRARAAIGRALGITQLDNRPGVLDFGWDADYWRKIKAGSFEVGSATDHTLRHVPQSSDLWFGKFPVTYAQFRLFFDAPDGYWNDRWWDKLHENGARSRHPDEQDWKIANHPVEMVSWYDAMAFCAWLTAEWQAGRVTLPQAIPTSYVIRLPTEDEWSTAVRWSDGERRNQYYAWGNDYRLGYANIDESGDGGVYLRQTSSVGIYPQGTSPYGLLDSCGNVWEWTLTEYDTGNNTRLDDDKPRTLRGGSWANYKEDTSAASRVRLSPGIRLKTNGFRIMAALPVGLEQKQ